MKTLKYLLFSVLLAALLAGCGFQLRGNADLPFNSLYISGDRNSIFVNDLMRNIRNGSRTTLTDSPKEAEAVLALLGEARFKDILSIGADGRVREFRLRYSLSYQLRDAKARALAPAATLELHRDITFNDAQVLAKEAEENLMFQDMQRDAVQLLLRRLSTFKPNATQS